MMPVELRDEVLILRQWRLEDAAWYAECVQDAEVQRFTTDPPTLTPEDVAAAIAALADQPARAAYLIADGESGQRLGNIALDWAGGVGDLSYWVASAARGRGVATHALTLLATAAFEHLQLRELRLWTHEANTASRRVAERAGFRRVPARDRPRNIKGETWPTVAYGRLP